MLLRAAQDESPPIGYSENSYLGLVNFSALFGRLMAKRHAVPAPSMPVWTSISVNEHYLPMKIGKTVITVRVSKKVTLVTLQPAVGTCVRGFISQSLVVQRLLTVLSHKPAGLRKV